MMLWRDETLSRCLARAACGFLLALVGLSAHGQTTCYQWQYTGGTLLGGWFDSPEGARSAGVAVCNGSPANKENCTSGFCTANNINAGFQLCEIELNGGLSFSPAFPDVASANTRARRTVVSTGVVTFQNVGSISRRVSPNGCPVCPPQGTRRNLSSNSGAGQGSLVCVSGCEFTYSPGYLSIQIGGAGTSTRVLSSGVSTGRACGQTGTGGQQENEQECHAGADVVCAMEPPLKGALVNGDSVLGSQVPNNGCVSYASGSVACDGDAAAPPAPDNGTPTVPAQPNVTVTTTTTTTNYFNSTTVSGSSSPPQTSPPSSGEPEGGEVGEEESGSVTGGLTCATPPVCDGDPLQCAAIDQQWRTRCVDIPTDAELTAAFGPAEGEGDSGWVGEDTTIAVPESLNASGWISNTCPQDVQINLGGQLPTVTIPISNWCDWMGIFGVMIMVGAYLGGVRIIIGGL